MTECLMYVSVSLNDCSYVAASADLSCATVLELKSEIDALSN